eukprot:CAMPEP_0177675004 /NCGR_PEP_ID=MMETSP0447-20121125/26927_1 /TAXON_ID=0 /ORGANISM="Stygamoeba regulata, Strain BSH-02190019" /LENGTH=143 /DNA_ID=CAMNT_0019183277 /DNA_START=668 /DNA_END=1099 /DNA_ORIENTATION=-
MRTNVLEHGWVAVGKLAEHALQVAPHLRAGRHRTVAVNQAAQDARGAVRMRTARQARLEHRIPGVQGGEPRAGRSQGVPLARVHKASDSNARGGQILCCKLYALLSVGVEDACELVAAFQAAQRGVAVKSNLLGCSVCGGHLQ